MNFGIVLTESRFGAFIHTYSEAFRFQISAVSFEVEFELESCNLNDPFGSDEASPIT